VGVNEIAGRATHVQGGERGKGDVFLDSQRLETDYSTERR
jgi:hypothetical protein